jgi:hypothetical protein
MRRVRRELGATAEEASEILTDLFEADQRRAAKAATQMALNLDFAMLALALRLPTLGLALCAFLAGWTRLRWGFTVFHDASHFPLTTGLMRF